jgi:hypothetical protein
MKVLSALGINFHNVEVHALRIEKVGSALRIIK